MKQDTLLERIYNKQQLTENERDNLVSLLSARCQSKTIRNIRRMVYDVTCIKPYGILGRVIFDNESVSYCAGQSYTDEIRTVRQIIINGR